MAGRLLREAVRQKIREYVNVDPTGRVEMFKKINRNSIGYLKINPEKWSSLVYQILILIIP